MGYSVKILVVIAIRIFSSKWWSECPFAISIIRGKCVIHGLKNMKNSNQVSSIPLLFIDTLNPYMVLPPGSLLALGASESLSYSHASLSWYKHFCMRYISYRLMWIQFINMLSVYVQSGTHRRFNDEIVRFWHRTLLFWCVWRAPTPLNSSGNM